MKKIISFLLSIVLVLLSAASLYASADQPLVPLETVEFLTEATPTSVSNNSVVPKKNSLVFTQNADIFVDIPHDVATSSSVQRVQFDARDYGYVTSVKNQGTTGGCWSFCVMSSLESDSIIKGYKDVNTVDFSESHLLWFALNPCVDDPESPVYGDGTNVSNPYFYGGNWLMATSALARWSGVAEEAKFPYLYDNIEMMGNYPESDRTNKDSGIIIESAQVLSDVNDIKSWIVEHGAAMALLYYDKDYLYNFNGEYSYYFPSATNINHAVTIVGWDDSYSATNFDPLAQPLTNGAWLCKNSWGKGFGNNGYFWVSYSDPSLKEFVGFTAQEATNFRHNYTYNGTYWVSGINHQGSAEIANVFKATEYETLTAVSAYFIQPGTDVTVSVYKDSVKGNPVSGTLAYTYSTHIARSGYQTIRFPGGVDLEPQKNFTVVLKLSHSSGTVFIPIESSSSSAYAYSSKAGQSFLNLPAYNKGWYDVQDYKVNNAYIQAFTECKHQNNEVVIEPTCLAEGTSELVCSQCGEIRIVEKYQAKGHSFSEWSDFEDVGDSPLKISSRTCSDCGFVENRSYTEGNTYSLTEFFRMLFDKLLNFFKMLFQI